MTENKSLYQLYRPRTFQKLVGQEELARTLRGHVANNQINHAYLFYGMHGCGKTTAARILARAANCDATVDGEPCNKCESCIDELNDVNPSIFTLDAASNSSVASMRDVIDKTGNAVPGKRRVVIIDEAHMLSDAAQNAFLKTLETPPPGVIFILATTAPQKMLRTILSRCLRIQVKPVPFDKMKPLIQSIVRYAQIDVSEEIIDYAIKMGRRSVRDTLTELEVSQGMQEIPEDHAVNILEALSTFNTAQVIIAAKKATDSGADPRATINELILLLESCFLYLQGASEASDTQWYDCSQTAQALGARATVRAMEYLGTAIEGIRKGEDGAILLRLTLSRLAAMGN